MARVNVGIGPGELTSPFGERFSFPIGHAVERPIEQVYWVKRVAGVTLEYESPEEEARAAELEAEEEDRLLKPLHHVGRNANAYVTVPSEGIYDLPIVVVNPRGLLDRYDPGTASPTVKLKLEPNELREVVQAVLQAHGAISTPEKQPESPPHNQALTLPPESSKALYDNAVDAPDSKRDTAKDAPTEPIKYDAALDTSTPEQHEEKVPENDTQTEPGVLEAEQARKAALNAKDQKARDEELDKTDHAHKRSKSHKRDIS